jgi:catechol 2,3-dioxygenase-like lactoylglutathione lyase family enzyme
MQALGVSVAILVNDLDRAVRFYRDRLGFAVVEETESWAALDNRIALMVAPEPMPDHNLWMNTISPVIEVADAQAAFEELTARGIAFLVPPTDVGGATMASFRESEGNLLQLIERHAPPLDTNRV